MLKRMIGVSGLLCGLLLVSGALARPHPRPGQDNFDKVGRPDANTVQVTRDEPRTYHKATTKGIRATGHAPADVEKRRQKGELFDDVGQRAPTRAREPGEQRTVKHAGKSPAEQRAEKVANCSEFNQCSAPATNRKSEGVWNPWARRQNPRALPLTKPELWDKGQANSPYSARVKAIRMQMLSKAFMPELGNDCRNGTDCWLP